VIARIVLLDRKGLSLVEVMIALVILLLVMLTLMQTALLSINANMNNLLRDEAVSIAEQHMLAIRNTPFASVTAAVNVPDGTETRSFRNITLTGGFAVRRTVTFLPVADPDNKQVDITVSWTWKGETFTHSINAVLRRPS
jgi:prepilin-type N-terminal cleavage/methylation domain-containing protein